jgi:hypothetical protein
MAWSDEPAGDRFDALARVTAALLGEHAHAQRQQRLGEVLVVAQHHRALDGVLQLAHVARPGVAQQHVEHLRLIRRRSPVLILVVLVQEVVDQPGMSSRRLRSGGR